MLTNLEMRAISRILAEEAKEFPELVDQIEDLEVQSREHTGTGFITNLRLADFEHACEQCPESMRLGQEVVAHLGGARILAGFVLYVDSGQITGLEGFTYGEAWPEDADALFDVQ